MADQKPIIIRRIPADTWMQFRQLCLALGVSANERLKQLIAEDVRRNKNGRNQNA